MLDKKNIEEVALDKNNVEKVSGGGVWRIGENDYLATDGTITYFGEGGSIENATYAKYFDNREDALQYDDRMKNGLQN